MPAPKRRLTAFAVAMAVLIATPLAVMASDRFVDVPDNNVHHADITWLADAGVTLGCNPPANDEFCPEDPVLRQQMASFLRRLAENQVVDAATAVSAEDAEMLGGAEPEAYQTLVAYGGCGINDTATATSCGPNADGALPDQTTVELASASLSAPAAGVISVSSHAAGTSTFWVTLDAACAPYIPGNFVGIYSQILNGLIFGGAGTGAFTTAGSSAVGAGVGSHVVRLCSAYEGTDGGGAVLIANLTAEWNYGGSVQLQSVAPDTGTPLMSGLLGG